MSKRQRLLPGMRKVTLASGAVRYEVTLDAGPDPVSGRRRQTRKRYATLDEAVAAHAKITSQVDEGTYVARSPITVDRACADYLAGRHNLRPTSLSKLAYDLAPLRERHGDLLLQSLTKRHIDDLVKDLRAGGTTTARGRTRRPWSPAAVNKVTATISQILDDALEQGFVARNVAAGVDRVPAVHKAMDTYEPTEVKRLLAAAAADRNGHAWHLALSGLRRGEIAGLRWVDVDLGAGSLTIANNRTSAGGVTVEGDPKSSSSRRTLPLTGPLRAALDAARVRQKRERLALGADYGSGEYVVSNEAGDPYNPAVLSRYWADVAKSAGVRHIRLHDARHTAATTMHLQGVPVAVIAAWIGHSDASFTMRVYAHSQNDALRDAATVLGAVVTGL
ncbi:MAG: site-specific integrase [Rhodococcus sp.]|nr:site-specific integrase [Rhodococcus sp. (in: high G+C Gram-positive bacteria)]